MIGIRKQMVQLKFNTHQHVMDKLERLREWQWLSPEAMASERNARLEALLKHAYEHVPYYRQLMVLNGMVEKGQIRLDRFEHLPFLDKDILRDSFQSLRSDDLADRKWRENSSGGSTGKQAVFIQDDEYHNWAQANKILFDEWSGRSLGDKQIRLWGSVRDIMVGKETWRTYTGRWLRNEIWLNAYNMSDDRMDVYVRTINRFKPLQILTYVESIYNLARYIQRRGISIHAPRSIMTTAGVLTEEMRNVIEEVFQTEVFNRYGSREVGDMACECSTHKGLHVSEYYTYVEIVRDDGTPVEPGEIGHIVVTSLTNYAMPIIRYRIGDMGAWSEETCGCGRPHRMLREVIGRESDMFYTTSGDQFHGSYFTLVMFKQQWAKQYQVVQEQLDLIRIRLVDSEAEGGSKNRSQELDTITSETRRIMGSDCRVEFEFTEQIEAAASGKYRYVICNVDPAQLPGREASDAGIRV
jgi:phenylacetate-CoA ligase